LRTLAHYLRTLSPVTRSNVKLRRKRHRKLFEKNKQGLRHSLKRAAGWAHQANFSRGASFSEVHNVLSSRQKMLRRRLATFAIVISIVFAHLHSLAITEAYSPGSDLSVDETYALLAGNTQTDSLLAISEEGFFMKGSLENSGESRAGVNGILEYTVEPGDSVSMIAHRFGISSQTILAANNLPNANHLKVGQTLKILPVHGVLHEVTASDTVDSLAKKYEIEAADILEQNNLIAEEKLNTGVELIIPGAKTPSSAGRTYVATSTTSRSVGAMPDTTPPAGGKLLWPTSGKITQYYRRGHYAIDIGNRSKPMIVATKGGTVITSATGWNGGYGNHVIIDHGDGMQTLYAHLDYLSVGVGDEVGSGDVLGRMGNSGRVYGATGIHLHFEIRVNGIKQNPLAYL
jgi:murein DD-endopeptidase MepM/ murein hydrolase activator NlpD